MACERWRVSGSRGHPRRCGRRVWERVRARGRKWGNSGGERLCRVRCGVRVSPCHVGGRQGRSPHRWRGGSIERQRAGEQAKPSCARAVAQRSAEWHHRTQSAWGQTEAGSLSAQSHGTRKDSATRGRRQRLGVHARRRGSPPMPALRRACCRRVPSATLLATNARTCALRAAATRRRTQWRGTRDAPAAPGVLRRILSPGPHPHPRLVRSADGVRPRRTTHHTTHHTHHHNGTPHTAAGASKGTHRAAVASSESVLFLSLGCRARRHYR